MRWGLALIALAGCDKLFDIEPVDPALADAATIDAVDSPVDASRFCPTTYEVFAEAPSVSMYRWVGNNVAWASAEQDCVDDSPYPITHLVVFDRVGEMAAVRDVLDAKFGQFASHAGYARNVLDNPFEFYAVTGELLPQTRPPWNMNEPTGTVGAGEETTVRFESFADLVDQPWDTVLSYLCECDQRPETKTFDLHR